jgi:hypothetical protein
MMARPAIVGRAVVLAVADHIPPGLDDDFFLTVITGAFAVIAGTRFVTTGFAVFVGTGLVITAAVVAVAVTGLGWSGEGTQGGGGEQGEERGFHVRILTRRAARYSKILGDSQETESSLEASPGAEAPSLSS